MEIPALQWACKPLEEQLRELFKLRKHFLKKVLESKELKEKVDGNLERLPRENNSALWQVWERIKDSEMVLHELDSMHSTSKCQNRVYYFCLQSNYFYDVQLYFSVAWIIFVCLNYLYVAELFACVLCATIVFMFKLFFVCLNKLPNPTSLCEK